MFSRIGNYEKNEFISIDGVLNKFKPSFVDGDDAENS